MMILIFVNCDSIYQLCLFLVFFERSNMFYYSSYMLFEKKSLAYFYVLEIHIHEGSCVVFLHDDKTGLGYTPFDKNCNLLYHPKKLGHGFALDL